MSAAADPAAELVIWSQAGPKVAAAVHEAVPGVRVVDIGHAPGPDELAGPAARVVFAVPRRDLPKAEIQALEVPWAEGIEWVQTMSAGVDEYPRALLAGRLATCLRGVQSPAIAEFVLATMLAAVKDLPRTWEPGVDGSRISLGHLSGRTLGLVGFGSIAQEVARKALAFDMTVIATRRTATPSEVDGVTIVGLDEVLARADHLVLAAPSTADSHRLIDAAALAKVKPGVHLVNVARGSLVDQDALLVALDDGRVGRASLDVTDPEPLPVEHPLSQHANVYVSPHVSWSAPDILDRALAMFVDNLRRYLAGEPLEGIVDTAAGY